jgi:murein tripeptide amidase MpaA
MPHNDPNNDDGRAAQTAAGSAHFAFDRFYRYDELSAALQALAAARADLVRLASIGKSHEGRDIWVATVTDFASGAPEDKPGFWVDGNIHSVEVSASTANLYFLDWLVRGFDAGDADIRRALQSRTFYICPRINPDGAEWALADAPRYRRSSTRRYPVMEDPVEGFEPADIDGDGRILRMRIPDPHGHWKQHPEHPRLLVRRDPAETGGQYYRLLPEGRFVDPRAFDGTRVAVNKPAEGLDLNRNFPGEWRQEFEQLGAGDYPTSEPEVRAVVQFFVDHPNLTAGISFHTFSGVLLRPFGTKEDDDMTPEDLWVYKKVGAKGVELTGYPAISVYEEFRYHPKEVITGTFDWIYEHLGLFTWTVELWSPMREAGIEKYDYIDWFRDHPDSDDVKLLEWNDRALGGRAYHDWKPFDHPELGRVEIGGWDAFAFIHNVPPDRLEAEVARFPKWLLWQALISPKLELRGARAEPLAEGLWRLRIELVNTGWLPTTVSKRAVERKQVPPLWCEIELPEGAVIEAACGNSGASHGALKRIELGQLAGWSHRHSSLSFWPDPAPTADIAVAEWILRAAPGASIAFTARAARAGTVRGRVRLGDG